MSCEAATQMIATSTIRDNPELCRKEIEGLWGFDVLRSSLLWLQKSRKRARRN